jgi:hypothetical protein
VSFCWAFCLVELGSHGVCRVLTRRRLCLLWCLLVVVAVLIKRMAGSVSSWLLFQLTAVLFFAESLKLNSDVFSFNVFVVCLFDKRSIARLG